MKKFILFFTVILIILSFFSYFSLFKKTYLLSKFQHELGNCYISKISSPFLSPFIKSDSNYSNFNSVLVVFEDGRPLGPAHSGHKDIREIGMGRYSHWCSYLYLSTSDNTNPVTNNRKYTIRYQLAVPLYMFIFLLIIFFILARERIVKIIDSIVQVCFLKYNAYKNSKILIYLDKRLFYFLIVIAVIIQAICFFGTSIMYMPDSGNYIASAISIKNSLDFSSLGFTRTPGYPLLLAGIFKIFGFNSTFALRFIQHFMCFLIIILTYLISLELFNNKKYAFVCGLFACFSFQLWSYADFVMTEVFYSFILAFIIYSYLKYSNKKDNRFFVISFLLTGIATNIRPIALLLVIPLFILFIIFYFTKQNKNRFKAISSLIIGFSFFIASILPWMIYNHYHQGFFGMTKYTGLNLYSRVVEYENKIDYSSPYIQDIKNTVEQYIAIVKKRGEIPSIALKSEYLYNYFLGDDAWKHHWPAFGDYIQAKKIKEAQADDIFLHAALDCIKKYPLPYILTTFKYIYLQLVTSEPTYLYIPGLNDKNKDEHHFKMMLDVKKHNEGVFYNWGYDPSKGYLKKYESSTILTPIYANIINMYHRWIADSNVKTLLFILLIIGFIASIYNIFLNKQGLAWFAFNIIIIYHIVFPMMFIPGTQRMRLPVDPFIAIFYVLGFFTTIYILHRILLKNKDM